MVSYFLAMQNPRQVEFQEFCDTNIIQFIDIMEKEHGKDKGLPGHSYTNKQLFWIAAAQVILIIYFAIA